MSDIRSVAERDATEMLTEPPSSRGRSWLLALTAWLLAPASALAQAPASESVQQKTKLPGLLSPIANVQASNQSLGDITIVQEYPRPETFTFAATQEFFYTDNVSYVHDNPQGSAAYAASYTASYVPYSTRDWTPRLSVQYNMFRYDTLPAGDFDNEQAVASSTYVFGTGRDWSWTTGVVASRYTAPHLDDDEFYREMIYDNQVTRVLSLSDDTPVSLVMTYDVAYHQASPSVFDYLSNGLVVSLVYTPIPEVTIAPYINPTLRTFPTNADGQKDRMDAHLAEGLDVIYQLWEYCSLDASIYHVNDFSNNSGLSFNYTIPGISLTGQYKF